MALDDIAVSRKQRVFAVLEDTKGTLQFPSATDFIYPAGDAVMNQNPAFTDSEEKVDSLDVLDRFQDARPAGTWTVPMYVRPAGTIGSDPQGDAMWKSMMGEKKTGTTASLSGSLSTTDDNFVITDLSATGSMPEKGVVLIESEYIYYDGYTESASAATATLTSCTRGYGGSTAVEHADNSDVTLKSVFYKQDTSSPSFSLWIETDHFVQGMSGCSVQQGVLTVANKGAVKMTMSGGGMEMVWAGATELAANAASGDSSITVDDADQFAIGAFIQNYTQSHTNSSSGYEITGTNSTTNVLTLGSQIEGAWATDDDIYGYLPTETATGEPVENRHTTVKIDGATGQLKATELTFATPKQYLTDEVGTDYPEDYIEDRRSITSNMNIYFRADEAKYFAEGYDGNEVTLKLTFGNTFAYRMEIYMKKVQLEVPQVTHTAPSVSLNMPMKALGTSGEDSAELCFM